MSLPTASGSGSARVTWKIFYDINFVNLDYRPSTRRLAVDGFRPARAGDTGAGRGAESSRFPGQ